MSALIIVGQWLLGAGTFIAATAALMFAAWLLVNAEGQRLLGDIFGVVMIVGCVVGFPVALTYGLWMLGVTVWRAMGGAP